LGWSVPLSISTATADSNRSSRSAVTLSSSLVSSSCGRRIEREQYRDAAVPEIVGDREALGTEGHAALVDDR
jgi:hypothetical protein